MKLLRKYLEKVRAEKMLHENLNKDNQMTEEEYQKELERLQELKEKVRLLEELKRLRDIENGLKGMPSKWDCPACGEVVYPGWSVE
jgi:rubrerythrin